MRRYYCIAHFDKQNCFSLATIFFDSSKLIPLHPRNSFPEIFGKLRQSRLWPLHFTKNCYRKISDAAQKFCLSAIQKVNFLSTSDDFIVRGLK